jgi:hypothetical protein
MSYDTLKKVSETIQTAPGGKCDIYVACIISFTIYSNMMILNILQQSFHDANVEVKGAE